MIDVIVPVYAGEAETRSCLESVLAAPCRTEFELVVVDDCSPEPSLSAWLDTQAGAGRLTLLRHARNRGFVGAVNTGLALHPDRDVVLLNSDTQVANDWLDRLQACAGSSKRVATVTPFSNNATVCSYPFEGWDGGIPGGLGLAALDRLFADTLTGQTAELPTAIGFCMFIRRACMDAVGGFDERAFGRGYGEENDFSMRAAKAGWRHLLAADVFVYHRGAVSFGAGRFELQRRAEQALQQMHPDYNARVAAFIRRDALQPLRSTIDRARIETGAEEARAVLAERAAERTALVRALRQARAPGTATTLPGTRFVGATPDQVQAPAHGCDRPVLLHVGHSWGGGVERWIHDYAAADEDHWHLLLRSRSWRNAAGVRLELVDLAGDDEVLLAWQLDEPIASTAIANAGYRDIVGQVVELFAVGGLIVSSLIGHALDLFDTGVPTVVVLHDLVPFCPALFGWFGKPCIRCDRADLARCLRSNPENVFWHLDDPDAWLALREAYAQRLADPSVAIAAPSRTIHERYAHLFPVLAGRPWHRIAHGLAETPARLPQDAGADPGRRLRIVVPGRLRPHKGLALFDAIVDRLREFADLLLLGCGEDGRAYAEPGSVKVVEDYDRHDLADVVADFAPDCALLLSTVPESFSYTLSEMAALGVPAVATRLGAFAERITDGVDGFLVTPDAAAMIDRLRDLDRDRAALRRVATQLHGRPVRTAADMVRDYAPLLAPGDGAQARRPGPIARAIVQAAAARAFLHRQSEERQRHIDALGGRVRTQDEHLARIRQRLATLETLAQRQRDRLDDQRNRLQTLRGELGDERQRAAGLEQALAEVDARNRALQQRLIESEQSRAELLASTSWRVTQPLRAIKGMARAAAAGTASTDEKSSTQPVPAAMRAPGAAAGEAAPDLGGRAEATATGPLPPGESRTAPANADTGAPRQDNAQSQPEVATGEAAADSPLRIRVQAGDLLTKARMRRILAQHGDDPETACEVAVDLPPGFSVLASAPRAHGGERLSACFTGLAGQAAADTEYLAARLDAVIVPSEALAQRFRSLWPDSPAAVQVLEPPLALPSTPPGDREAARSECRERLGLPDAVRLVVGIDCGDAGALGRFVGLATAAAQRRNDARFVWLGSNASATANDRDLARLSAQRRLFLVEPGDDADIALFLGGADACFGCCAADVYDAAVPEALAAGLPVCVLADSPVAQAFADDVARVGGPAPGRVDAALGWLDSVLDDPAPDARRTSGDRARVRLAAPSAAAALLAALLDDA